MMKSLYEEFGGTYTLGNDGMLYPDLVIGDKGSVLLENGAECT